MSESLTYDNLVIAQGLVLDDVITLAAGQTVQRGDLLALLMAPAAEMGTGDVTGGTADTGTGVVTDNVADTGTGAVTGGTAALGDGSLSVVAAESWIKAAAAADIFSVYAIAAEDKTTVGETADILVYRCGVFNANEVGLGGVSTVAQNKEALAKQGIYLKASQPA